LNMLHYFFDESSTIRFEYLKNFVFVTWLICS
jgi:hypothetical protein